MVQSEQLPMKTQKLNKLMRSITMGITRGPFNGYHTWDNYLDASQGADTTDEPLDERNISPWYPDQVFNEYVHLFNA
ncbi:hypothetical protein WA026_019177 [Henosepilachna vigintioctopunctata]|uniref:Uncharacterized protein n=1 Tax=Henosepilachna vigintioctopunctata TaxID=420089 RepID=A0AAW1V0P4_9CUCU